MLIGDGQQIEARAHTVRDSKGYLSGIDTIRGFLALIVAYSHAYGIITGWNSGLFPIKNAGYAVDLFFIISSIVLLNAYYDIYHRSLVGWMKFILVRFFRLWPLYTITSASIVFFYVVCLGVSVPAWITNNVLRDIPYNLLLLNSVGIPDVVSINGPGWSISVEFWVGSSLILLCFMNRLLFLSLAAFVGVCLLCAFNFDVRGGGLSVLFFYLPVGGIRCITSMGIGGLVFEGIRRVNLDERLLNAISIVGLFFISFVVISTPIMSHGFYILSLVISSLCISCVPKNKRLNVVLENACLRLFGRLSYSIYLVHYPVLFVLLSATALRTPVIAHLAIVSTVVASSFAHKYVEVPMIRLGKRIVAGDAKSAEKFSALTQ